MDLLSTKFQRKLRSSILLTYAVIILLYLLYPILFKLEHRYPYIYAIYWCFFLTAILTFIFRNKISLLQQSITISFILISSPLIEYYFYDANKAYLFGILAISAIAATINLKPSLYIWIGTVIAFIAIDIFKYKDTIINNLTNPNITWNPKVEGTILFILITGIITITLRVFRKYLEHLKEETNQEKIKYKPLFEQTYSFITMLDFKGQIIESNQAALYYINSTNAELKNQNFAETKWWLHSEESKEAIIKNLNLALGGDFRRFEATHKNHDNQIEHFDYTLKPVFNDSFNVKYIIAEGRNITEFKHAKEALIESEERLIILTESSYEGIIITKENIIIEANTAAYKIISYNSSSELEGKNLFDFIHSYYKEQVLQNIKEDRSKPYQIKLFNKQGELVPVEVEGRSITYKGTRHRAVAIRDITERYLAEKALFNSEEKYRLITENINDIICKLDVKLKLTYFSSSIYNMLGYSINEIDSISLKDITTPNTYYKIISKFNKEKRLIRKAPENTWTNIPFEAVLKHKTGKLIWTSITTKLIRYDKDDSYEILCVVRNIDTVKKIQITLQENEARLKKQNEEYERLNQELTSLNEKLLVAKQKAEESDKLKSAFLANMSHEIRTPMNSIIGFSKILKSKDINDEKREQYADFVINNGNLLLSIVNDVLDLSKIESNQIKLKKEVFNLNELIEKIYKTTSNENKKGLMITLEKGLSDQDSYIYSDQQRLQQILYNLTNNAYKFTKKGAIKIGYYKLNDSLIFYIEDSGIGIPLQLQEKIFERFRQVELNSSRMFGGAGLGLSISKKFIELLGGKIWLKSQYGYGSIFYISLPYVTSPPNTEENAIKQAQKNHEIKTIKNTNGKITILVAEDNESNFFYINELLTATSKYQIIRAKNGEEAVQICEETAVNIVFMDIKMPIMDGLQATQIIKRNKPSLPIIAQTAFAMSNDRDEAIKCGCDDYISKPIDTTVLFNIISKYTKHE